MYAINNRILFYTHFGRSIFINKINKDGSVKSTDDYRKLLADIHQVPFDTIYFVQCGKVLDMSEDLNRFNQIMLLFKKKVCSSHSFDKSDLGTVRSK